MTDHVEFGKALAKLQEECPGIGVRWRYRPNPDTRRPNTWVAEIAAKWGPILARPERGYGDSEDAALADGIIRMTEQWLQGPQGFRFPLRQRYYALANPKAPDGRKIGPSSKVATKTS